MKLIEAIRAFWREHGTKALGTLQAFLASVLVAALAVQFMLPKIWQIIIAATNAFLGAWTIKRGIYNSKQNPPPA